MLTDEQLNEYRVQNIRVRVIRDANVRNDVKGFITAWNDEFLLIRKGNRKVVKLPRHYHIQPLTEERVMPDHG